MPASIVDPTATEFKTIFPEFNSVEDTIVEFYIDLFTKQYNKRILNKFWSYAAYLYTAHRLYIRSLQVATNEDGTLSPTDSNSITGNVSGYNQRIGDVSDSTTYSSGTSSNSDDELGTSKYGKELLDLLKKLSIGVSSVYSSMQVDLYPVYPPKDFIPDGYIEKKIRPLHRPNFRRS